MEIVSLREVDSTQKYLIDKLKSNALHAPVALIAQKQSAGVGSRENVWVSSEGDFLLSLALERHTLPKDLPLGSSALYFAYIIKETLRQYLPDIWLKWPNDIYYQKSKVGGVVTQKVGEVLVCGVGINLQSNCGGFESLTLDLEPRILLDAYLEKLAQKPTWKQIFIKFKLEFNNNKEISAHVLGEKMSLKDASLNDDGSLTINKKRIYSLR